ncbi:AAA family ATPase [Variovorax paradoxus]|uniref:AAA family ATPase n=1 Tax=Variovorax paradoxus TaxID=34073 RepID=UPI003ECFF94E
MSKDITISKISVQGLHDQFDVDLSFNPGLNIIYGKNGRGKTTMLHLLANAIELDFKRFSYLQFHKIRIENSIGDAVELTKESNNAIPKVSLNGALTSFSESNFQLSDAEASALRDALGGRPTYLPAFRSVLERARTDSPAYYRTTERRDAEFDEIVEREYAALRESTPRSAVNLAFENRSLQEEAAVTAQKSTLCRQWFGRFVPVIRYPSVADVEDALSDEWRVAHLEVTRREQRMFEEIFVKVFRSIAGIETPTHVVDNENLLASISNLLHDQESQLANSESKDIYDSLLSAARSIDSQSMALRGIDNSLLDIYRQVLEKRNTERRLAFQRSRDFELSVNKFLDKKTLRIGQQGVPRATRRSVVTVAAEGGHSYGLSALSSGERQILTMLYSASRTKFLSGIFLIDEPELSLHIDWQRIVLRELRNQSINRQIIACTHSPEVGADHMEETQDFEPRLASIRQDSLFSEEEL